MTPESHIKMIGTLNERFHQAPLEFGNLVVKFFTNRGVLAEITRHRLASFAVESTRYCNYSKGKFDSQVTFVRPSYWKELTPDQKRVWEEDCKDCEKKYLYRIETGWTPEQARGCLNMDAKTEINLSANFREWKHIFHLRVDSAAHPDIRALLNPLYEEMSELAPFVFKDNFLDNQSTSKFIAYLKLADDPKEVYNLFYKRFGNDNMAIMDFCKKVLKVEPLSEEGEIESVLEDMY
jgi:thymidylate synthase (FAD)